MAFFQEERKSARKKRKEHGSKWTAEQQKVIDARDRIFWSARRRFRKTAVLVERTCNGERPQHPIDIDQLLVVTFTRAAAGEMKENRPRSAAESLRKTRKMSIYSRPCFTMRRSARFTDSIRMTKNYFQMIDLDPVYRMADEGEIRLMKSDVIQKVMEERLRKRIRIYTVCGGCGGQVG